MTDNYEVNETFQSNWFRKLNIVRSFLNNPNGLTNQIVLVIQKNLYPDLFESYPVSFAPFISQIKSIDYDTMEGRFTHEAMCKLIQTTESFTTIEVMELAESLKAEALRKIDIASGEQNDVQ